jgi:Tfp pilus assembly protein PilO
MRSSPIWRRRAGLLAAAGLYFVGNLAFFLGYRSTSQTRREALEARRATLREQVRAREVESRKLEAQRDRLAGVSEAIEQFYGRRVGTRRETLAPIVEEIHQVLRRVGVSPTQITYSTAPVSNLPLSQMLIGFGFRSDYPRFKRLVQAFETNRRWIVVREAGLTREPEQPGFVQVRLLLATYFSGEGPEAEAVAAPPRRAVS